MTTTIQSLFGKLDDDAQNILNNFDSIIQSIKPLNSKHLLTLPDTIRELSHQLTDERSKRRIGYMNQAAYLSAYTRYFMWWNLFRLTALFSGLPKDSFSYLKDGSFCLDAGSGPLTAPIALLLSRPELRTKKITWYCIDLSQTALALGEELLLSVCASLQCEPWTIVRIKGALGEKLKNPVQLCTCANMFNEMYWDSSKPLEESAKRYSEIILPYMSKEDHSILIVEPGVPRTSRFISLTRDALLRKKYTIASPCPHEKTCPMDGRRGGKWCHFVLNTDDAPKKLHKLSKDSGLPKERAAFSFVFAQKLSQAAPEAKAESFSIRIASDPIKIPYKGIGRYACSEAGLALIFEKNTPACKEIYNSGDLVSLPPLSDKAKKFLPVDAKTGAKIVGG